MSLVKELRGDAANKNVDFYIGTVKNSFNEWYCPIDSTELNEQKWLNDGQDKWLIFVNEEPKMAWSHKCTYYYLPKSIMDGKDAPIFKANGTLPPYGSKLKLIEQNVKRPNIATYAKAAKQVFAKQSNNSYGKNITVIIASAGKGDFTKEQYLVCSELYKMLRNVYDIPKENFRLLIDDNTDSELDTGNGTLPHDIDGDGVDETFIVPTTSNFYNQLMSFEGKDLEQLFIYYIGSTASVKDEKDKYAKGLVFKDQLAPFGASVFNYCLSRFNAKRLTCFIAAPYSRDFSIGGDNAVNIYSSQNYYLANGTKIKEDQQLDFSNCWINGFYNRGQQGLQLADANHDFFVSMNESFKYACSTLEETYPDIRPMIVSHPDNLADELSFCPQFDSEPVIRDNEADNGSVPSKGDGYWNSPDIWIRNQDDGLENMESEHITAESGEAYIYTRIHNFNSTKISKPFSYSLNLFWNVKQLNGDAYSLLSENNSKYGGKICSIGFSGSEIESDSSIVLKYKWTLPQLLLDRAKSNGGVLDTDISAFISRGTPSLYVATPSDFDVCNSSRSAKAALTVVEPELGKYSTGTSIAAAAKNGVKIPMYLFGDKSQDKVCSLRITPDNSNQDDDMFKHFEVSLKLDKQLYKSWQMRDSMGENITSYASDPSKIYINGPYSSIRYFSLPKNALDSIMVTIQTNAGIFSANTLDYTFNVKLVDTDANTMGATSFRLHQDGDRQVIEPGIGVIGGDNGQFTLSANNISEPVSYQWLDRDRNVLGTDNSLTIPVQELNKQYTLKVTAEQDGAVAYATLDKNTELCAISVSPNPFVNMINVQLPYAATTASTLRVSPVTGNAPMVDYKIETGAKTVTIPAESWQSGVYVVSLLVNGQIMDSKQIIKQ